MLKILLVSFSGLICACIISNSKNIDPFPTFELVGEWRYTHSMQVSNGGQDTNWSYEIPPNEQVINCFYENGELQQYDPYRNDSGFVTFYKYKREEVYIVMTPDSVMDLNGKAYIWDPMSKTFPGFPIEAAPFHYDTNYYRKATTSKFVINWNQVLFLTWTKFSNKTRDLRSLLKFKRKE